MCHRRSREHTKAKRIRWIKIIKSSNASSTSASTLKSVNCPCVYHLANNCPKKNDGGEEKKEKKDEKKEGKKPDMSLFIETNMEDYDVMSMEGGGESTDDLVLVVKEFNEELVLNITTEGSEAIIDCACPTTVSGKAWIKTL